MDPVQDAAVPADSVQALSPAELQIVKDTLPQPPQTIALRVEQLEQLVTALRADFAALASDLEKGKADVLAAVEAVKSDLGSAREAISVVEALVPSLPQGDSLVEKFKAIEAKVAGIAGAVSQHFGIKL